MLIIKKLNKTSPVYDISVKDNENFYANDINVHNCTEIVLHTDESNSFVCCVSSLNLAKYNEWKDTNLIYDSTVFLDGVLEEFIQKAKDKRGFENSIRTAQKGRALGLGVLGWHTYLQNKGIAFDSLEAQRETRNIFNQIKIESDRASSELAEEYGEPLWCRDTGFRNTHTRAVAPTVNNSKLSGDISAGIEPVPANVYTEQSAKGTFIRKNPVLLKYLQKINMDEQWVWDKILNDGGSVQDLDFLNDWCFFKGELIKCDDIPEHNEGTQFKDVFKTFKEINQMELIKQAGIRQQYIDQSVSLNLAFPKEATPKWIADVHIEAWKRGIKTLYYMRTESVLRGDIAATAMKDCLSCDG